jgi:hypothetical protein
MIEDQEYLEHVTFMTGEDVSTDKTPLQALLYETVDTVNSIVIKHYKASPADFKSIHPSDILVLIVTNLFTNLSHNLMPMQDLKARINTFDILNDTVHKLSKKLFLSLQTYYADETHKS